MNLAPSGVHALASLTVTDFESGAPGLTPCGAAPSTVPLLPTPDDALLGGADPGAAIAALAVQTGQAQHDLDAQAAERADATQSSAEAAEVAAMREEASAAREGAWTSGLLQVGAGACSMGAAGITLDAGVSATGKAASSAGSYAALVKGFGEGLSGGSGLASGLARAATTDSEALAAAHKALADSAARAGGEARDAQKGASDFVQSALSFYREYAATRAQAQAAALHGA
jgi:hypothetical protein